MLCCSAFDEFKPPADQWPAETWLNIKRAFRIQYPAQSLLHDSGGGQRNKVTRAHITGITIRTVIQKIGLIDHRHIPSAFFKIICGTQPNHSTSHYNGLSHNAYIYP